MNTTLRNYCATLIMATLFTSCQRSIDLSTKPEDVKPSAANAAASNKCRLVFADHWGSVITDTYQYNAEGLVSDCQVDYFGSVYIHATMQYDSKGRLKTGTISYDNITFYDVVFEYENNRIVKEIVYEQGTSIIADYTLTTYNQKGQIIKRVSPPFNLYATFKYDAVGNVTNNDVWSYDNDLFVFGIAFKYNKSIKDPRGARPGMPSYSWWYLDDITCMFFPTERDEFLGDGFGDQFQIYDEDPSQTILNPTAQNLLADRMGFDQLSSGQFYEYWEYENCGGKNQSASTARKSAWKMDQRSKDIALLKMPLLRGPGLKKQLVERKAILQRLKK